MSPSKRKAPEGTGANPKQNQPLVSLIVSKYNGKVRPATREPKITHYGCSCCRWFP